jgi:hypothetical protein
MYLASRMPGRTMVLLTGQSLGAVGASVDLATALEPAMVVLEDVDLVAMGPLVRAHELHPVRAPQRHGRLDEDHDILFVLTTNRAETLEPALAARPGAHRPSGRAGPARCRRPPAGCSSCTARASTSSSPETQP